MTTEIRERRLKIMWIAPECLARVLQESINGRYFKVVENALPADAEILHASWAFERHDLAVVVRSSEFDNVPEGQILPELKDPILWTMDITRADMEAVEALRKAKEETP